jgi:hypothetical protein
MQDKIEGPAFHSFRSRFVQLHLSPTCNIPRMLLPEPLEDGSFPLEKLLS